MKTLFDARRIPNTSLPAAGRAALPSIAFPRSAGAHTAAVTFGLGLLLLAAALGSWPIYPVDETRYLSVAWEMWHGGDFLVPHLNGQEYSHKPPLLFWLVNLGWFAFGVNAWWPRVLTASFAVGAALLVMHVARLLWPSGTRASRMAPVMLQASGVWMAFTPAILFDVLLAFFVLLAMTGVLHASRGRNAGWLLCGVALGLGILAKGPVVLLHVAPAVIAAPWWVRDRHFSWLQWYRGFLIAVLVGAAIALAWALPAASRGSPAYASAIFWSQSADRIMNASAPHARPIWWYLPWLPLFLFPWIFWRRVWTGVARLRLADADWGTRFCLAWAVPVFLVFSFISGKQVHYLLPLVPCLALLVARALALGSAASPEHGSSGLHAGADPEPAVIRLACASVAATALVAGIAMHVLARSGQDLEPIAGQLKRLEAQGRPLAHIGAYYGEYHFLGRLERPFAVLSAPNLREWLNAHPEGRLVVRFQDATKVPAQAEFAQPYRGRAVAIISAAVAPTLISPEARTGDSDF